MRKYHRKFIWRSFFRSTFLVVILMLLVVFILYKFIIEFQKYLFIRKQYQFSTIQTLESSKKLSANQDKLDNINTEAGEEEYIRETYSVKKDGEGIIVLYNNPNSTYEIPKSESKWQSFKDYLKRLININ